MWQSNLEVTRLVEVYTHGPPWPHLDNHCDAIMDASHALYCASMGFMLRSLRNVCIPSGLARTHSYFDDSLEEKRLAAVRRPMASALGLNDRLMVLVYLVSAQPQVAVFRGQDVDPATRRLTARELAEKHCSREAQLPSYACNQMLGGFVAAITSFGQSITSATHAVAG